MNLREPSLHLILCVAAIIVGVIMVFSNTIHVTSLHEAVGIVLVTLGVLLLV